MIAAVIAPIQAPAQTYPSKPVRIIVPFGAGGPGDMYARLLAQHLSDSLKQPFVVETKPGAGATIGSEFVADVEPAL
jgi:tripartite-type tricarboxylate transporter receptor subunit TctC